jgi:hypothetical protein
VLRLASPLRVTRLPRDAVLALSGRRASRSPRASRGLRHACGASNKGHGFPSHVGQSCPLTPWRLAVPAAWPLSRPKPPEAGAEGPPLQGLPRGHTRPPGRRRGAVGGSPTSASRQLYSSREAEVSNASNSSGSQCHQKRALAQPASPPHRKAGAVTAQLASRRSAPPHDPAIQTAARLPARYARI